MFIPVFFCLFNTVVSPFATHTVFNEKPVEGKIKVELRLRPDQLKDSGTISYNPVKYILFNPTSEVIKPSNGFFSLLRNVNEATFVNFSDVLRSNRNGSYLAEPGDEVVISSVNEGFDFSGQGAEKYQLQYQLDSVRRIAAKQMNTSRKRLQSLADYYDYEGALKNEFDISLSLLENYEGKISAFAFQTIKDNCIRGFINRLNEEFYLVKKYVRAQGLSTDTMVHIYDSGFSRTVEKWLGFSANKEVLELLLATNRLNRTLSFDSTRVLSEAEMNLFLFKKALSTYKGQERESFMVNNFPKQIMNDVGFIPEVEKMLSDYYAEAGYPEWKKWMKEQELKYRMRFMSHRAPSFELPDNLGKVYTREDLKGKFVVLHFWRNGTHEGAKMLGTIKKLHEQFKDFSNLVFVNIAVDSSRDQWLNAIANKKIPGINLYTNGEGVSHDVLRKYAVTQYPTVWLLDPKGKVINTDTRFDLSQEHGADLKYLLTRYLVVLPKDGPYVWHNDKTAIAYNIKDSIVEKKEFSSNKPTLLSVQTDQDNSFQVKLQSALTVQPSEYSRPEKLLAFSDIEGNFDAFRKLLQGNGVVDKNFNWTFGEGHLVFAGDMFDRGNQVTECLWLLYSLEEKAKTAGGYVHFVLGNHEIMNLQGNHKYVVEKYKQNAGLLNKSLADLYNEDTEIGRWLRTKNIMEKIGDLLFAHGGISHQVWRMNLTLPEMNDLVRPYYARAVDTTNKNLVILYGSKRTGPEKSYTSPFWFRGYYGDVDNPYEIPTMKQVDSALQKFGVSHIITGHTIIAKTIITKYEGKVINTDTYHAKGMSEALLVNGKHFYRVDTKGNKILLFTDDVRKVMTGSSMNTVKVE